MGQRMRKLVATLILAFTACAASAQEPPPTWSYADLAALERWAEAAPLDALPAPSLDSLEAALASGDAARIDSEATALALLLARAHLLGSASPGQRRGWNIVDPDAEIALEPLLALAVENDLIDTFFSQLRPMEPQYSALRAAYSAETDERNRAIIALNMERWRWMPRSLGDDYVLVNTADFEAGLWRGGEPAGTWKVIVGKPSTPTPVFGATITGVTFNPWWEVPASIVRESVGALTRNHPSLARARGYVWGGGSYRQRPGPNNALGQMKIAMPNPYSVYMHDTPNRDLFEQEVRAFSHGCIRTGDALAYAATLLNGVMTDEDVATMVATGQTETVDLAVPLPIYVAYFTATGDGQGGVRIAPDIYHRDGL